MGADVTHMDDVPAALHERKRNLANRGMEPVIVAWDGKLNPGKGEIVLEDGTRHDGHTRLAPGYHRLHNGSQESLIISAPTEAYFPFPDREWGIFIPIYALHSKRNPAAGDLTDFSTMTEWMSSMGGRVAATLPLLASFLDEPFEPSPYSPASRLFWNEFYIDVTRVPEFAHSAKARKLMESAPHKAKFVDYRGVMAAKRTILEELTKTLFSGNNDVRKASLNKFIRANKGVEEYARFRAVTDRRRSGWTEWPAAMRDGHIDTGDFRLSDYRYHLYSQWIVQSQLDSMSRKVKSSGQVLYLDLPLGLHPDSYDIWHERDFFLRGVAGGAPPDIVFTKGQNWGFPPMHPDAMRMNRHQYTIAYIQNHLRYAQLLRIDHVMGLHRLYCIPDGQTGDKGVYLEYPADELYAILSIESHRHKAGIVGENLGTVPPIVNSSMAKHNIQQMYVVQYEIVGESKKTTLRTPPRKSVASLNTHDMPPFRAFWDFTDIDDRLDLKFMDEAAARDERKQRKQLKKTLITFLQKKGFLTNPRPKPEDVFNALLAFLTSSPADIVLVNMEDLWQETEPQNVPATHRERPNWRRRIRPTLEKAQKMPEVIEVLEHVLAQRSRSLPV
jgi:4-alpha-glucanotransferase